MGLEGPGKGPERSEAGELPAGGGGSSGAESGSRSDGIHICFCWVGLVVVCCEVVQSLTVEYGDTLTLM